MSSSEQSGGTDVLAGLTPALRRAVSIALGADAKQASNIVILEVGEVLGITEYFVIAGASNTRLSKAIAEEVQQVVRDADGDLPLRMEGMDDRTWILLDYGDVVVHVFTEEVRSYYELERLWGDVNVVDWKAYLPASAG